MASFASVEQLNAKNVGILVAKHGEAILGPIVVLNLKSLTKLEVLIDPEGLYPNNSN